MAGADAALMQQAADGPQVHKTAKPLQTADPPRHQLPHVQLGKALNTGCLLLREHQLGGFGIHLQKGNPDGFAHQCAVVVPVHQLRAGNKPPQALHMAGAATTVHAADHGLHHGGFLGEACHGGPAIPHHEGPTTDGDHAFGILLTRYQHLQLLPLGELLRHVGDDPETTLLLGHPARRLAPDIQIYAVAFVANYDSTDLFPFGAKAGAAIQGRLESFFIKVNVIHAAGCVGRQDHLAFQNRVRRRIGTDRRCGRAFCWW